MALSAAATVPSRWDAIEIDATGSDGEITKTIAVRGEIGMPTLPNE
jgi:hypothetical protein